MLQTSRLKLVPLSYLQLCEYLKTDNSLEKSLGVLPFPRPVSKRLEEVFIERILPHVANKKENYLYNTLWSMILTEENKLVGDLCFKGKPNTMGAIEIGYGTYPTERGKGYMTEAVGGLLEWASQRAEVKAVVAYTDPENIASRHILEKNGFIKVSETKKDFFWKKEFFRP